MRRRMAVTIAAALFAVVAAPALAQGTQVGTSRCRAHEVQAKAEDAGGRHSHGEGDELARVHDLVELPDGRERLG